MTTSRNEECQKESLNVSFVLEQAGRESIREAGKKGHHKGNRVEVAAARLRVLSCAFFPIFYVIY